MKKVGIRQVAEQAGVSVATVSYVMSGNGRVSKETRTHVLKTAEALGFIRNESAARLRSGQSKMIGVILNNIVNPFFSVLVAELEAAAYREGFLTVLATAQNDHERQSKLIESMVSQGVAAIILSPVHETTPADLEVAQRRGIPVVSCVRDVPGSDASFVGVDDHRSGYIAARTLIDNGCRTAAFIGGYDHTTTWNGRRDGMLAAFREAGLPEANFKAIPGFLTPAFAESALRSIAAEGPLPDAVMPFNDDLATGIYAACRAGGIKVGTDLSIVSFDNVPIGTVLSPQLSTVDIFPGRIGAESALRAMEMVRGSSRDRREIRLAPEVVNRGSVRRSQ
ncbi:LacI family transcriptional regulator [Loktanella sp. IMCC34160]|uniref:LacI family DNA-binding transcriptional regulator n=1 Tax=Loktanella sp. IMCC34160 TaxID=2510646 RepID=UPI00101DD849|nr:LacI family DNA-binding transcriptional regulator [Loktanella sp. IMCC34160]RYG90287.1 LacI family transcriptional regulator [Loktanella sp. IMCC34160]